MEEVGIFHLETSIDGCLNFNFTSPEQDYILLQPDAGVGDNDEATTLKVQAVIQEEFASPTKKRQLQEMTQLGLPSKTSNLIEVGHSESLLF